MLICYSKFETRSSPKRIYSKMSTSVSTPSRSKGCT
jgi:hypothetical protein